MTLISTAIIGFLVMIEVWSYLTPVLKPEIVVDGGKMEKLPIHFDITFPNLPCHCKYRGHPSTYNRASLLIRSFYMQYLVWMSWTRVDSISVTTNTTCSRYDWMKKGRRSLPKSPQVKPQWSSLHPALSFLCHFLFCSTKQPKRGGRSILPARTKGCELLWPLLWSCPWYWML